jgi:hypothetical protein
MPPDPWIAVTIAIIAALAGVIAAMITRSAAAVTARQQARRVNIEHCDLLIERIAALGQECDMFVIVLTDDHELSESLLRSESMRALATAYGTALGASESLALDAPARAAVQEAVQAAGNMLVDSETAENRRKEWHDQRRSIKDALVALGRERDYQFRQLEVAAAWPWTRREVATRTAPSHSSVAGPAVEYSDA